MERLEKRKIMLEYSGKGRQFHYNMGDYPIPDIHGCYLPLGWCSIEEADFFCTIVQPFMTQRSIDTPIVPFEVMKEAWGKYCRFVGRGEK